MPKGFKKLESYDPIYEQLIKRVIEVGRVAGSMSSMYALTRERFLVAGYLKALQFYTPDSELAQKARRIEVRTNRKTLVLEVADRGHPDGIAHSFKDLSNMVDSQHRDAYTGMTADEEAAELEAMAKRLANLNNGASDE